jgi:hypothetical protein
VRKPDAWTGAVESAADALRAAPCGRAALQVVLSGQFVRWQHIPWMPEISHPQELVAYAQAQFAQVYGARAQDWQITLALQQPGYSTLACAIDRALLMALQSTAQTHLLRLSRVTPYFACAHDHWQSRIADASYWFGVVETGYFTLGLVHLGQWRAVRGQRFTGDVLPPLQACVAQLGLATEVADTTQRIFLVGNVQAPPAQPDFPITWLQPTSRPQPVAPDWRLAWGL